MRLRSGQGAGREVGFKPVLVVGGLCLIVLAGYRACKKLAIVSFQQAGAVKAKPDPHLWPLPGGAEQGGKDGTLLQPGSIRQPWVFA